MKSAIIGMMTQTPPMVKDLTLTGATARPSVLRTAPPASTTARHASRERARPTASTYASRPSIVVAAGTTAPRFHTRLRMRPASTRPACTGVLLGGATAMDLRAMDARWPIRPCNPIPRAAAHAGPIARCWDGPMSQATRARAEAAISALALHHGWIVMGSKPPAVKPTPSARWTTVADAISPVALGHSAGPMCSLPHAAPESAASPSVCPAGATVTWCGRMAVRLPSGRIPTIAGAVYRIVRSPPADHTWIAGCATEALDA